MVFLLVVILVINILILLVKRIKRGEETNLVAF